MSEAMRSAILSLRDDWSADVRDAVGEVLPWLPGADGAPPAKKAEELPSAPAPEPANPHDRVFMPVPLGAAAVWGDALWESVYVNELPVACKGGATCRCTLDRFEDFLDGSDHASHGAEAEKERAGGRFSPHSTAKVGRKIDPDPELSAFLSEPGGASGAAALDTARDGQLLPQGESEDDSIDNPLSSSRNVDDVENEEDLGIIDAGDEEWVEVFDVIREHSAVTIFNHTDSTWYVSSRHPNLVRPLHGKRRHPLLQQRQRSPSPPSIGIVSERPLASSPRPWPRRGGEQPRAGSGHRGVRMSAEGGEHVASAAASLLACMDHRRRPHSAPNRVSAPHLAAPESRRFSSAAMGGQWSGQRPGRSSRAAVMAPQWQVERSLASEGQPSYASGSWPRCSSSDRSRHSAAVADAWGEAQQDYREPLQSRSWRAASPPASENDFIVEEDGGSSSSGLSAMQPSDELQRIGELPFEDGNSTEVQQHHGSGRSPCLRPRMVRLSPECTLQDVTDPSGRHWPVPPMRAATPQDGVVDGTVRDDHDAAPGEAAGSGEVPSPRSLGEAALPPASGGEEEDVEEDVEEDDEDEEEVPTGPAEAWLPPRGGAEELDNRIEGELEGDIGGPG